MATKRRYDHRVRATFRSLDPATVLVEEAIREGVERCYVDSDLARAGQTRDVGARPGWDPHPVAERDRNRNGDCSAELDRAGRRGALQGVAMILVPRSVRVYFATEPMNLHRSFDGLSNEIRHALGYDPLAGHVFVFVNRRKNQVKLIVWTRGGFTIVHKSRTRDLHVSRASDL